MLKGRTSIGGANPKVVEEKLVGVKLPPCEKASPANDPGPSAPLVVALLATGERPVFAPPVVSMGLFERSFTFVTVTITWLGLSVVPLSVVSVKIESWYP